MILVLLNLIYGHTREVPRKVELWMFAELTILVDKYKLLETTGMVADYWFRSLKSDIPQTFTNKLLPWVCLSWVFQKPEIFKKVTRVAQIEQHSKTVTTSSDVVPRGDNRDS